jgi:hypothetical protein
VHRPGHRDARGQVGMEPAQGARPSRLGLIEEVSFTVGGAAAGAAAGALGGAAGAVPNASGHR